jgi:hypothetical protein
MNTINGILEPHADGSLHLPLPEELRQGKVHVTATLQPVASEADAEAKPSAKAAPQPGSLKGFWMAPDFDEPLEEFKEYME